MTVADDSLHAPQILGIGGAHVDRIGHVAGQAIAGASNPGRMIETVGGGMLNALRVASLRGGGPVALVSARGGDTAALAVEQALEVCAVTDMSGQFLDRMTASYTAIHGPDGDVITALADMDIYETALPRHVRRKAIREAIAASPWLVLDTNMPAEALAACAQGAADRVAAMGISAAKIGRLSSAAPHLDFVFCNAREACAFACNDDLDAALVAMRHAIPKAVLVVSNGAAPVTLWAPDAEPVFVRPSSADITDVTGAGDALTGGMLASLAHASFVPGHTDLLHAALLDGMACAACALGIMGPVSRPEDLAHFDAFRAALAAANPDPDANQPETLER